MVRLDGGARSVLPACVGFGLYWAWVYLSFDSGVFLEEAIANQYAVFVIHGVSCASALAGFALYALIGARLSLQGRFRLALLGSLIASAGTLFYAAPPFSSSFLFCLGGACVSGIGAASLVVGWGVAYAGLPKGREVGLTALSFLISFSVFALVSCLGYSLAGWAVSMLPCLSGVGLMRFSRTHAVRDDGAAKGSSIMLLLRRAFSWRFVSGLVLTMVSYGGLRALFADAFSSGHESWVGFFVSGIVAVALFLVVGSLVRSEKISIAVGYKTALPLIALACSLVLAFGANEAPLADAFATAASALIEMLTWVILLNVSKTSKTPSIVVFAAGRIFVHAGIFLGESVGFVCVLANDAMLFVVASVVMVVIAASVLFADGAFRGAGSMHVRRQTGVDAGGGIASVVASDSPDADGRSSAAPTQAVRTSSDPLERLAVTYALTAREKEVLDLWGMGYGSKYIEDKLCISQATVKTHVRHIYDKVGVRSRPELMLRLEELSDAGNERPFDDASSGS